MGSFYKMCNKGNDQEVRSDALCVPTHLTKTVRLFVSFEIGSALRWDGCWSRDSGAALRDREAELL